MARGCNVACSIHSVHFEKTPHDAAAADIGSGFGGLERHRTGLDTGTGHRTRTEDEGQVGHRMSRGT